MSPSLFFDKSTTMCNQSVEVTSFFPKRFDGLAFHSQDTKSLSTHLSF